MRIAFDIDGTLLKMVETEASGNPGVGTVCPCGKTLEQVLDEKVVYILMAHLSVGDQVALWSAGGPAYAYDFMQKHLPELEEHVSILDKEAGQSVDICYDDQEVNLAALNLRVKREHSDHWP